ncbi:MAG: TlpA family protein disulfide reductase [Candidatus Marinimicrobia bacterium]|nr:TlpA family protein disulfide reductase [Candidatus Neomarinimicrobiota bacterium]MBL7010847.1 TlpA family protein disulfide reductase [Candidatus Neomarinimicrobiota bacterium]MBL7031201.1 TlpA family protein disulfide reductase [Candidatus Neomarinimicrobiota bacterium]
MKKILPLIVIGIFSCSKPDLQLTTINSGDIHRIVNSHTGKDVVLINFWATWCAPCIEEFPMIVDLSNKYSDQDVKIYFVSTDWEDETQSVIQFLKDHGVTGKSFIKAEGNDNEFIQKIHKEWTGALPFTIIYDEKGAVSDYWEMKKSKAHFETAILRAKGE